MSNLLLVTDNNNNVFFTSTLPDNIDSVSYRIVENPPEINPPDGYYGIYELNSSNEVVVNYYPLPSTLEQRVLTLESSVENIETRQCEVQEIVSMSLEEGEVN